MTPLGAIFFKHQGKWGWKQTKASIKGVKANPWVAGPGIQKTDGAMQPFLSSPERGGVGLSMHKGGVHGAWEMGIEDKAQLTPVSDL